MAGFWDAATLKAQQAVAMTQAPTALAWANSLPSQWSDVWSGITSPGVQSILGQTATVAAAGTAGAVAPSFGIAPNAANVVVASAPYAAQQTFDPYRVVWIRYKLPLLIGGVSALGIAALKRSSILAVLGAAAVGGYLYGRSKYEA